MNFNQPTLLIAFSIIWLLAVASFSIVDKEIAHWGAWLTGAMLLGFGIYFKKK